MENHRVASIHPIHAWQKEKKRREEKGIKGRDWKKLGCIVPKQILSMLGKKKLHKGSEIVGGKQQQANGLETTNSRSLS